MDIKNHIYYNYNVIDLESLLKIINIDIINYCLENNLEIKLSKDFKKIFTYYFFKRVCNKCLLQRNKHDHLLFCNPVFFDVNDEIFDYINIEKYNQFVNKILNEFKDILPIKIYFSKTYLFVDILDNTNINQFKYDFDKIVKFNKSSKIFISYIKNIGLDLLCYDLLSSLSFLKLFIISS